MNSDRLGQSSSSRGGLSGSNEDSSVVSLKALVAKASPQKSAAPAATFDDSGLIDLNKLKAMENAAAASGALSPVLAANEAGLFAMPERTLTPQVAAAPSLSEDTQANPTAGRGKWLVVGAVAALLAIVGTFGAVYMQSSSPAQSESTVAPATETTETRAAETSPRVEPTPAVTAAPAPTTESRPEATQARPNRQAAISTATQNRAGREVPVVQNKPEQKPAPSTPCDLRCEIERAAKKKKSP